MMPSALDIINCKGHFIMLNLFANIVQMVKTCYKIKIDFRDSSCCFYWFLQQCQHSE